ncbi:MAG: hypothetical protein SFU53_13095 [Terrimicrobiaceae bacterium]|nr:hypothetical protein [Terrimicrobiaceae bacterium]
MRGAPRKRNVPARFRDEDYEEDRPASKEGSLFVWTIVILLLIGFAIACWIGSFYVFGHPEKPFSYEVLTKLDKLEPPKRFELTAAPRGEFLRAKAIAERYGTMTPRELERANENLIRNYLRNYKLTNDLVPYVVGTFNIIDSYELTSDNFFTSGVVAVAQSKDDPGVILEQIFPAEERVIPALHRTLLTGLDIDLKRENELAALINVSRLPDGRIKATAVSILYPSYESTSAMGTFSLQPPERLNVRAGLPIVTEQRHRDADAKYASYRRRAGLTGNETEPPEAQNRLMRVERPVAVNLAVQPTPPVEPEPTISPAAPVLPDDAPVRPAIPVNATPPPMIAAAASPSPADVPPTASPSPAQPAPSPAAVVAASSGSWPVYAPGQMPRGRLFGVREVSDEAGVDVTAERTYLQGNFVVTASGPNRAVLRNQGSITQSLGIGGGATNIRIIVEYPAGVRPPAEGSTFSRDARRPFQITEIRRGGTDGQVNVYVREVTRP